MFEVGDYLIYGLNGVCRVEAVGTMEMSGMPKDRLYYTLIPVGMPAFHAGRQCQNGNTSVGVTRGSACVYRPDAGGGNDLDPGRKAQRDFV